MEGVSVSGRALLGLLRQGREARGQAGFAAMLERADVHTRGVLSSRVRQMGWYPYDAYVGLMRLLDAELGRGDTLHCRKLGAKAGEADLGTIFRVYAALASPERLIRSCSRVWPAYHRNAGRMEAVSWDPEGTVLRIYDFPQMAPEHCRLMEGWMISVMKQIGIVIPDSRESACMSKGDDYHQFECVWTRARG